MCVPLIVTGEVIGMIVLGHHQPGHWGEEKTELIQTFANQAAVAIVNVELYEKANAAAILEERTRLSRDLHDSTTQSLYSATLFCEAGKELAEQGDLESARFYLSRVGDVIHQALKDMRLLVFQLRSPMLEDEGLAGAVRKRLDAVEKRAGMEARLIGDPKIPLTEGEKANLYAIAIEALNNVLRHAEADSVTVTVHSDDEVLTLEVLDDGRGFDLESERNSGGMGLENMRERAAHLGGELTIASALDQGTSVKVSIPLTKITARPPEPTEISE
jgi:signal transduction histidine kinase